jgi:hypothetical protein
VVQLSAGAKDLRLLCELSGVKVDHNQLPLGTGTSFGRAQNAREREYDHLFPFIAEGKNKWS